MFKRFYSSGFRPGGPSYKYKSFTNSGAAYNWNSYRRPLIGFLALGAGFYAINLEQVPFSKRWRFMICPRWLEKQVGYMGYKQVMMQYGRALLPDNHSDVRQVRSVMKRLIAVSGIEDADWEVHVIGGNNPPNAFVLPGGKVFVFQSMLPLCQDADGLAAVLSHETAHQVCRHSAESLSKSPLYLAISLALFTMFGSAQLGDLLIGMGLKLPASREMETEADRVGVMMMAKACFQPEAAVGFWQRMLAMEKRKGEWAPELLSTHPASSRRIENIKQELPEAQQIREENCGGGFNVWGFR